MSCIDSGRHPQALFEWEFDDWIVMNRWQCHCRIRIISEILLKSLSVKNAGVLEEIIKPTWVPLMTSDSLFGLREESE